MSSENFAGCAQQLPKLDNACKDIETIQGFANTSNNSEPCEHLKHLKATLTQKTFQRSANTTEISNLTQTTNL